MEFKQAILNPLYKTLSGLSLHYLPVKYLSLPPAANDFNIRPTLLCAKFQELTIMFLLTFSVKNTRNRKATPAKSLPPLFIIYGQLTIRNRVRFYAIEQLAYHLQKNIQTLHTNEWCILVTADTVE